LGVGRIGALAPLASALVERQVGRRGRAVAHSLQSGTAARQSAGTEGSSGRGGGAGGEGGATTTGVMGGGGATGAGGGAGGAFARAIAAERPPRAPAPTAG